MNEIIQQRIESVQAGRNITHAQIVAKRNLREQLERDLENFLASGGKTQVLPTGFTHFKDGIVPKSKARTISEKERFEKEKAIEAKNQEIREHKEAVKAQRRLLAKNKRDAQIKEQVAVLGRFTSKHPTREEFKQLAEMTGYQTRHLRDAAKGHTKLGCEKWVLVKKVIKNFKVGGDDHA